MRTLPQIVMLRGEFEIITEHYQMPEGSDIHTIKWFTENGHRSNRLRPGYEKAQEIAAIIKEYYYGTEETGAWVST
jgi:uncharacterized protein YfaT (DUF1175 family)